MKTMRSDEQLIGQYLKGEETAFDELVARYLPLVYSFSRHYTGSEKNAADITQETFIKTWKNLKKFDRSKTFKPWLFTIARNTALDWLRKKDEIPFSALENEDGESIIDSVADPRPSAEYALGTKNEVLALQAAAKELPENYQAVLALKGQDFTFREIAERTKTPLNTIKSRYLRAIAILKKQRRNF